MSEIFSIFFKLKHLSSIQTFVIYTVKVSTIFMFIFFSLWYPSSINYTIPRQSYFTHIICFQTTPSRNALIPHNRPTRSTFPTPTPPNSFSVERGARATCWTVPRGQYGGRAPRSVCRLTLTLTYPLPYRKGQLNWSLCVCVLPWWINNCYVASFFKH